MINPFTNFSFKPSNIIKFIALLVVGVIVMVFVIRLVGATIQPLARKSQSMIGNYGAGGSAGLMVSNEGVAYDSYVMGKVGSPSLSARNILPTPPIGGGSSTGNTAEQFEVKGYQATIETRDAKKTCSDIVSLKPLSYVIFENANEYDRGCSYVFKVEKDRAAEIVERVKALDPKHFSVSTHTIKNTLDDFTSRVDILKSKQKTVEETLQTAVGAYDEISRLAAQTRDAQSLANIIDSKLRTIERLTQERLSIAEQLEQLSRSKAEQLDRVDYTYFSVNVVETVFVDGTALKDSWKNAIVTFVRDVNKIVQDISIRLVTLILVLVQYIIYLFVILFVIRMVWKGIVKMWKSERMGQN